MNSNFQLKILATNWGFSGTMDEFCSKVKHEGYDGFEIWWPAEQQGQEELFAALKKYSLEVGFLTAGHESNFTEHFASFKKMIATAAKSPVRPLYINCHSGRDYFSFEENKQIIDYTIALAKESGVKICHETHRSRLLYSAPAARQYFEKIPELRITFDVSHWCNVSESLLHDQQYTVGLALDRVDHIHARVGHPEGPQVSDPRAPEWAPAVKAHFEWWDKVVAAKKQKGETLTVLTEFGPPDYMPTLAYTRQPLADQWAINVYMMHEWRKRYTPNP
ncbi:sugar phosphate isomerase/epimerase family protein [Foetidibacter luteolus]|uniref:sugar phosphate isomerase/epimerase family protein n=1 Tax=Foetidibacter luteolus TaxID=2608880 RepID=UPI001F175DBE|nr:TIM barrel protein [Foetidibacter luteolus]